MTTHLGIKSTLLGMAATAATTLGGEVAGISADHTGLLVTIATIVGTVVGTVTWIDARIDKKIKDHTKEDKQRHEAVLGEISHLRELLAFAEIIPATTPAARVLARPAPSDDDTQP
jgi:uncharacterized membrane protein YqgA involved in biofilm formation